jgi:gluconokinase
VRSVLEGTIFNLYAVYNLVKKQAEEGTEVKIFATGGFTQSELWKQILADVFQKEVSIPQNTESSCLGAVLLGRFAIGLTDVLQEVKEETKQYETIQPNSQHKEICKEWFEVYQSMSQLVQPYYTKIHTFQNKHKGNLADTKPLNKKESGN